MWPARSFDRLRWSGSRLRWAEWHETAAARKRPPRRLLRPAPAGQRLAQTAAGNAADSVAGRADRRGQPPRQAEAGTHRARVKTYRAGTGTHRARVRTQQARAGARALPARGWSWQGGMNPSMATSSQRLVNSGERHRLGRERAWSTWPRTRWRESPVRCLSELPVRCGSGRSGAERLPWQHARRPHRIASPASVAGRTERRIAENPPKRLLIRSSIAR